METTAIGTANARAKLASVQKTTHHTNDSVVRSRRLRKVNQSARPRVGNIRVSVSIHSAQRVGKKRVECELPVPARVAEKRADRIEFQRGLKANVDSRNYDRPKNDSPTSVTIFRLRHSPFASAVVAAGYANQFNGGAHTCYPTKWPQVLPKTR